jgi:magnesium-transporting ATPase (P-type)
LSIGLAILGLFWYELSSGTMVSEARAIAVASLIVAEIFLVTIELSRRNLADALKNRFFWVTRLLTIGVLLFFLYFPPMAKSMQLAPIDLAGWLKVLAVALFSTFLMEGVLYFSRPKKR